MKLQFLKEEGRANWKYMKYVNTIFCESLNKVVCHSKIPN